jgi:Fic family protein
MAIQFHAEKAKRSGRWDKVRGPEPYYRFLPHPLPPNPPLLHDNTLLELQEKANRALGRLDNITQFLPNPSLFLYTYVRREAVLSSQIEGTQSTLTDLLLYENNQAPGVPVSDVREVSNYVEALDFGLRRLKDLPISLRLFREIHKVLLSGSRGADKEPGEFRRSQNWVGGNRPGNAKYVPPPPEDVIPMMGHLEHFLHGKPIKVPTLLKAGMAHAQIETIHPFLDGNGRIGRLLITFILCAEEALSQPLLYLSLYFKENREEYYERLQRVRTHGEWEEWMSFYLIGVEQVATQAASTAKKLLSLFEGHRRKIQKLKKAALSALQVHELLQEQPVLSTGVAQKKLDLSFPSINKALNNLENLGVVRELTGRQRDRSFSYESYLQLLGK